MLQSLYIKNIALISELNIDFSSGLNIITGETGAGKSIIIDSINLVLGERAGKELIKTGETRARVEAEFSCIDDPAAIAALEAAEIEIEDDTIVISRELSLPKNDSQSVKSVCRINGSIISLSELKSITEHLVDVHGQHEHQSLLAQSRHMEFLDSFSKETAPIKQQVRSLYKKYHETERNMHSGFVSEQERAQRIDILSYQINEIEAVSPELGEDERLEAEHNILSNGERIMQALYSAANLLTNGESGALNSVKAACDELYPITSCSDDYKQLADSLSEAYYNLESAAYSVKDAAELFTFDAKRLDEVEARISAISKLKRKYGNSIESVIDFLSDAQKQLDDLENGEKRRQQLAREAEELKESYTKAAGELSSVRQNAAQRFSELVTENMYDLGLKKARFEVSITKLDGDVPSADGTDFVEFMFSANPGEPLKPLRKVASGGEMSRIMLALKTVLADTDGIDTMIFDEIDTGISGNAATVVGAKMAAIAKKKQVFAITHLPQIAAFAQNHFMVEKTQLENSTISNLRLLSDEERIREVARIMGGADSELALKHATELIEKAASLNI